jgi:HlyD family secretion protein
MTKRNKLLAGGTAAALVVGVAVVTISAKRDRGVEVREERVTRRDLVAAVTASGKIQPEKKVDVSADITGRITKIAVREGELVTKGQFLLQIDPTVYEANLERARAALSGAQAEAVQAQANRDQAERALKRTKELRTASPNLVAPEQMEQAETAFEVADANRTAAEHQVDQSRAAVQEANDNLRKTHLVAPMSGRVTRLPVEEGEVAVPSTFSKDIGLLMTISDLSVIQAKVQVDETDVVRLHLDDSVEVSIDAFPDTTFTGRVSKVSNSSTQNPATTATGQNDRAVDYEVEITLDHPPADVRPSSRIPVARRSPFRSLPSPSGTTPPSPPRTAPSTPAPRRAGGMRPRASSS